MIYLDNNATTRVADEVLAAMQPYYSEHYGNPHSPHALGRAAHDGVERARAEVARLLGADGSEIVFTSCGTESNAMVLRSVQGSPRRKVVMTSVEHPSVRSLLQSMADRGDIELAVIGVDRTGRVDLDQAAAAIDDATLLVSVMQAQNETGVIHPVAEIAALARKHGALVHVDAVQAAAKIEVNVQTLGADFLSISGHKFHAPKGVGALYVRRGLTVDPLWLGGGQEHGLRSGTEAVPSIVGVGAAARLALEALDRQPDVARRRDRLERNVLTTIESASVNGAGPRLPNTASISFRGLAADKVVDALDERGLCASAGAACHSGAVEPSAVMRAMGVPDDVAIGTVRFSLSRYTTDEEIEVASAIIAGEVRKLREKALVNR